MLPQAAAEHYRSQQARALLAIREVRREWATIGADFDAGWARIGPRITALVSLAQLGSARSAAEYVPAVLAEQGIAADATERLSPRAFAGVASSLDGVAYGSLDSLLYGAVIHARSDAQSLAERLNAGRSFLDRAVQTQVADAARQAVGVGVAIRGQVGWARMVNPPCCQRCAVLAGRVYRYSQGFQRHPHCDCTMIPTHLVGDNPPGIVVGPDDVKDLTKDQRRAIGDGADFNQVVNSHRGRSKDLMSTNEGATRRGIAGKRLGAGRGQRAQRLTPEGIYKVSATRDEALKRLRDNGYLL